MISPVTLSASTRALISYQENAQTLTQRTASKQTALTPVSETKTRDAENYFAWKMHQEISTQANVSQTSEASLAEQVLNTYFGTLTPPTVLDLLR